MNYFKESEDLPILSSWITQGFVIDKPYILEAIETDRNALETDTQLSTVATFGSLASGCLMLALGGITAPMIIPIVMIGAASITAWNSDCSKSDRELEAKFLRAYPSVFDRLSQRISDGEEISRIASDYGLLLKAYRRADRTVLASLVDANTHDIAPTPAIVTTETFIPNDFEPVTVTNDLQPIALVEYVAVEPIAPSYGVSKILTPLDKLLASPYQSRAWFGAQRTGKSYLAAITSQQMFLTLATKVFHINLHSFGTEDRAYWVHARSVTGDMGHMPEHEVYQLIDKAIAVVKEFSNTQNALLIFDEITLTGAINNPYSEQLQPLLAMVASSCSELASTGKKRRQAIWTISPDFVAMQLTQETKAIKSLAVTFVAIPPGKSLDWEGQAIGFHSESFQNVQRNFTALKDAPRLDCDRMVFLDGLWLDMGELPKLITASPSPIEPVKNNTTLVELLAKQDKETDKVTLSEPWINQTTVEVEPGKAHPLVDNFDRLESLISGKDSLPIRDIQRALSCKSEEATQIAQMFCMSKKSSYKFSQSTNSNGTLSKSIMRV